MKWNKIYSYPKTVRSSVDGVRKYSINDEKLPSVTTIISNTQDASKTERSRQRELGAQQLPEAQQCTLI